MALLTLLLGLASWIIPIYSLFKKDFSSNRIIYSLGLALLSVTTLYTSLSGWIEVEDWSAILDVYPTSRTCVILLVVGVIGLNFLSWVNRKRKI
ncbi:hypothetical protein AAK882_09590 [Carnobacteriaceae bacterium 52-44]|jgi:hypothetical protein